MTTDKLREGQNLEMEISQLDHVLSNLKELKADADYNAIKPTTQYSGSPDKRIQIRVGKFDVRIDQGRILLFIKKEIEINEKELEVLQKQFEKL